VAKSKEAFRTISEVAAELDVPQHVLRFWETKFNQIKPLKRGGGRRYYRPEDVDLLKGIQRLLHTEGYTIKGVQKIFREHGAKAVQRGIIGGTKTGAAAAIASSNAAALGTESAAEAPQKPAERAPQQNVAEPDLFGNTSSEGLTAPHRKLLMALRDDLDQIRRLLKSTL
jgi:DNA-binding transcriptional MerR regulator